MASDAPALTEEAFHQHLHIRALGRCEPVEANYDQVDAGVAAQQHLVPIPLYPRVEGLAGLPLRDMLVVLAAVVLEGEAQVLVEPVELEARAREPEAEERRPALRKLRAEERLEGQPHGPLPTHDAAAVRAPAPVVFDVVVGRVPLVPEAAAPPEQRLRADVVGGQASAAALPRDGPRGLKNELKKIKIKMNAPTVGQHSKAL